jgi:hypothetical protein
MTIERKEQLLIDHEVRIRLLENIAIGIEKRFDKLESKMDSQFHWVLGTMFTLILATITLFGGIILHMAKLI